MRKMLLLLLTLTLQFSLYASESLRVAYINLKIPYYKAGGVNTAQNQMVEALQNQNGIQAYYISPDKPAGGQHSAELNLELKRRVEELVDNRIKTFSVEKDIIESSDAAYWSFRGNSFVINSRPNGNEIPLSHSGRSLSEEALNNFVDWVIKNKIQILHCQYPTEIDVTIEVARRVKAKGLPIKTIYQDHSTTALSVIDESIRKVRPDVSDSGEIAKKVYQKFFGPRFKEFDTVFCSTGIAVENYLKMGLHDNIEIVPISIKTSPSPTDKKALRSLLDEALAQEFKGRKIATDPGVDIFVLAGRVDPRKNVDQVIESIAHYKEIQKSYDNPRPFQLILMGPYQAKEQTLFDKTLNRKPEPILWDMIKKHGLEDDVLFTGVYNQEDFLNVLDYYKMNGNRITNLHFSKLETFGMAVREALIKQVPVVGTDTHNAIMKDFLHFIPSAEEVFMLSERTDDVAYELERLLLKNEYFEQFSPGKLQTAASEIEKYFNPNQVADAAFNGYNRSAGIALHKMSPKKAAESLLENYRIRVHMLTDDKVNNLSCVEVLLSFPIYK